MNNLHINFEEFIYIQNKYEIDKYQKVIEKSSSGNPSKEYKGIRKNQKRFDNYAKSLQSIQNRYI